MSPPQALFPSVSLVEELLLTRYRTFFIVRRMPYSHLKFRGHAVAYLQHTEELVGQLPWDPSQLPILIVRAPNQANEGSVTDYRVDSARLVEAYRCLKVLYPHADLYGSQPGQEVANFDAFRMRARALRLDGNIFDRLPSCERDSPLGPSSVGPTGAPLQPARQDPEFVTANMDSSFIHSSIDSVSGQELARRTVQRMGEESSAADDPIGWPTVEATAVHEGTPLLLVGAFPLRFLNMFADFTLPPGMARSDRRFNMELYTEGLMWFYDPVQRRFPFSSHPTLQYYLRDRIHRTQALSKAFVFARNLPHNMTVGQLQAQLNDSNDFTVNKLYGRATDMKNTTAYLMAQRTRWYNLLFGWLYFYNQTGHIFVTVSEPELQDPFLHRLLDPVVPAATRYLDANPRRADELKHRKLAVVGNLQIVSAFFEKKMRSLHCNLLYPLWNVLGSDWPRQVEQMGGAGQIPVMQQLSRTPIEQFFTVPQGFEEVYNDVMASLPATGPGGGAPVRIGGHGGRREFAERRMMTHLHEVLMLPDAPDVQWRLEVMREADANGGCSDDSCPRSRALVEWVTEHLGLNAIHSARCRSEWPAPEGSVLDTEKRAAGLRALKQTFSQLQPNERLQREVGIENYCMLHECSGYCLRDVKDKEGNPTGEQRCRMHAELRLKFCCDCEACAPPQGAAEVEPAEPDPCLPGCNCHGSCCTTRVWMLEKTFRFELRVCRRHGRCAHKWGAGSCAREGGRDMVGRLQVERAFFLFFLFFLFSF